MNATIKVKLQQHAFLVGFCLVSLLIVASLFSLMNGAVQVPLATIKEAFFSFDKANQQHQIILSIRLPRIIGALVVGASLAITGALAQGITQNPLADSGLLGINAGAGLGLAAIFAFFPSAAHWQILLGSFLGAGISISLIYLVSSRTPKGATPIRLTLAGAGISALFLSLSQFIALQFNLSQDLTFWSLGGVSVITWAQLKVTLPIFILALLTAVLYSSSVTILRFGDDTAISLGKKPQQIRLIVSLIILFLSGLSVALVGSISFVGLIIPHIMRTFAGENYKKLIPLSGIAGALLVICADWGARMLNPPFETPFGIVTALIGIPFFVYLFKKGGNLG